MNNSTINNKDKNTYRNNTLFTKSEKTFLSKLIPDNYLNNYENRFNSLINENRHIKTKMIEDIKLKSINKTNNMLKLECNNMQKNIINKKTIALNSKFSELNKKKREINEKIKKKEKLMQYNDIIFNKKNNEFNKLLKEYKKIYENIRNGQLVLKKGVQLTRENIEAIDKYGMRGSNNTSFDGINEDVDYANVSDNENEEGENDNDNEENNGEEN